MVLALACSTGVGAGGLCWRTGTCLRPSRWCCLGCPSQYASKALAQRRQTGRCLWQIIRRLCWPLMGPSAGWLAGWRAGGLAGWLTMAGWLASWQAARCGRRCCCWHVDIGCQQ
eukprot:27241-Chlamydomonas_euryale.AAC.1